MDVAARTDALFRKITRPDGKEYSCREIAEKTGETFTSTTVWKVRSGQIKNPTFKVLKGICKAFGVSINYYADEHVTEDDIPVYQAQYLYEQPSMEQRLQDLTLATKLRQSGVADVALKTSGLDDAAIKDILGMIDYIRMARQAKASSGDQGESE
jgi:transcriptional regulator with XRE-family HTH domain